MGQTTFGIPKDLAVALARADKCGAFLETGTFRGETTVWAASEFSAVDTIEIFPAYFQEVQPKLRSYSNIQSHLGDSLELLPGILASRGAGPVMFWLDAHRTAESKCESNECSLLGELDIIRNSGVESILLIDDARLFLSAPPRPANPLHWPTLPEVVERLPGGVQGSFVQIIDDVIVSVARESRSAGVLRQYAQDVSTQKIAPRRGIRGRLGRLRRRLLG